MNAKLFEVRDRGTFMVFMGINMNSIDTLRDRPVDQYAEAQREYCLLRAKGFGPQDLIMFVDVSGGRTAEYDPYSQPQNPRTTHVAHLYVQNHWDELKSGDVIDVEFILGETQVKKEPQ